MAEREGLLKRLGKGFDRYVGGLLGEDISTMTPEEKAAARRSIIGVIGRGMVDPGAGSTALSNVVAARAAQRNQGEMERRQKAAEEEMTRISARLFGGVAPTGQMIEGLEPGEAPTPVTSYYRQDPTDALRRMYGTQAGRDVAQIAPDLAKLAQEGVTGRTVGASVYNPLTQRFAGPPERKEVRTPVREVDAGDRKIVYFNDGTTEIVQKRAGPSAAAAGPVGPGGIKPTKGQEAVDKKFAETISDYVAGGGYADIEKQITQLDEVAQRLRSGEELSGPMIAAMIENYPNLAAAWNAGAIDVQELVGEVAQRNLRAILGGQFAQQEGVQLIKRAYNPALREDINAERIERLATSMRKANQAKNDAIAYWNQYGTLAGFKGKIPTSIGLDTEKETKAAPNVGEIQEKGGRRFQYLGGDPANPNSWKRL